jgi:hypothetical protein
MIEKRHTVRKYLDKPLDVDLVSLLNARIEQNNKLYDLTFKLVTNNSDGLSSLAKIMSNNTIQNYIVLAGKECSSLDEKIGYCGADLILYAQSLGLKSLKSVNTFVVEDTKYRFGYLDFRYFINISE